MAYQQLIIQLKPHCDPSDFTMVKLQQTYANGRVKKLETPATEGSSIEQILYCTREFLETASQLNFETGPELFDNFQRILKSTVKDDWDLVVALAPHPRTPVVFHNALDEWKKELIMSLSRQTMVDNLENITKPCNMMVEHFVTRVRVMVRNITDFPFPGPKPPTVDSTKLKNIIFRAMPMPWQTNFLRVNDISTTTVCSFSNSWLRSENLLSHRTHSVTCVAIEGLKMAVICACHKIQGSSAVQDAVEVGTVMLGLIGPGITIMTTIATCDQRMQQLSIHADRIMVHILGHSADKTQIRIISKDECRQDEVVASTQANDTMAITTTVETILKTSTKIRTNHHRISIKTRSKIHPIKWWYTPQITIPVLPEERKVTLDRAPGTIMGNSSNQMALLLTYPVVH
jgi:hypothetical protein